MKLQEQVIYDGHNNLYVMCWTEGNTVFLTDDLFKIERYTDAQTAISTYQRMKKAGCRFLRDTDDSEVSDVHLNAGMLEISAHFSGRL
jgi:hypothetical protein